MSSILVVEDEENLRFSMARRIGKVGHEVMEASTVRDAIRLAQDRDFDLVLTDINLPDGSGVDLLSRLRADGFEGAIVLITAYATIESAVDAMKKGADEYLQKPVSMEELALLVERALKNRRTRARLDLYERLERTRERQRTIIGASEQWTAALSMAERLAEATAPPSTTREITETGLPTIMLIGETGSGKGLLARHIHERTRLTGDDEEAPFIHVNCSALPAPLVESELFGHEKGAFTDAKSARPGLFEMAEGGTIFLDEIAEMPSDLQAKLLLVLEHGRYRRVGGTKERVVRARVIAATNQDLEKRVEEERFRRDLFYRLNTFTIEIPPLRERGDDVMLLAEEMLAWFARRHGRPGMKLGASASIALKRHSWAGNVRELMNVIQRAVMLAPDDEIKPSDLGLSAAAEKKAVAAVASGTRPNGAIVFDFEHGVHNAEQVERALITQALDHTKGNVSRAARLIGMNRSSFRYRLERFGLEEYAHQAAQK